VYLKVPRVESSPSSLTGPAGSSIASIALGDRELSDSRRSHLASEVYQTPEGRGVFSDLTVAKNLKLELASRPSECHACQTRYGSVPSPT
jgi:ABC-type branched-subunit amino acid transport system ATPase component